MHLKFKVLFYIKCIVSIDACQINYVRTFLNFYLVANICKASTCPFHIFFRYVKGYFLFIFNEYYSYDLIQCIASCVIVGKSHFELCFHPLPRSYFKCFPSSLLPPPGMYEHLTGCWKHSESICSSVNTVPYGCHDPAMGERVGC